MTKTNYTVFKSAEGKDKVLAYYGQVLSVLPFGQKYIDTSYGKTFILEAGHKDNPPVILLHGSCSNSAFWFGEMTALAENYHVMAVDILGEAGNSAPVRYELAFGAYAQWIKELLATLSLPQAVFIGNSLGAWMALDFATTYPESVKALVLLAAAGIAPVRESFIKKTAEALSQDEEKKESLQNEVFNDVAIPKEVSDFIQLIVENYHPITGDLPIFSDEKLRNLHMPLLAVWGKEDIAVEAEKSAQRLSGLAPNAKIEILDHCGHVILGGEKMMLEFLAINK